MTRRLLVAVALLLASPATAKTATKAAAKTTHAKSTGKTATKKDPHAELEARMAAVRTRVAAIDRALPATKVEKSVHGCGAETGTLTAWMDGTRIVKIEAHLFAPAGEVVRAFWFDGDGKLLYAKIVPPAHPDDATAEEKHSPPSPTEYFYDKGEIFRWTSGPTAPPPEEVTATADELSRGIRSDDSDVDC